MPFKEGNQLAKGHGRPKKETPKTIWLLQSLQENGVDLQSLLAVSILKAAKGDRQAMDLAHLLTKLLPLVTNAPKNDAGTTQIETLVINRFEGRQHESRLESHAPEKVAQNDTSIEAEVVPPTMIDEGNNA